jgi:hypothetical protein
VAEPHMNCSLTPESVHFIIKVEPTVNGDIHGVYHRLDMRINEVTYENNQGSAWQRDDVQKWLASITFKVTSDLLSPKSMNPFYNILDR